MSLFKSLSAVSSTAIAKIFTALGALALLWFINELAGKSGLGLLMIVYALNYIFATTISSFFGAITRYHVARDPGHSSKKAGVSLTYGIVLGFMVAYAQMIYADELASIFAKSEAAPWISAMALMVPAFVANALLNANERARGNVPRTMIFFEIAPMVLQLIVMAFLLWGGLSLDLSIEAKIGASFIASFALPFIALYLIAPITPRIKPTLLSWWDLRHGFGAAIGQFTHKSMHHIVLVMLGLYTSAGVVAEFAVALRFANFLMLPKLAISQLQVPRMGRFLKDKNLDILSREFDLMRMASLAVTILIAAIFMIIAPPILKVFGAYAAAYPVILLLCIAGIIRAGFGTITDYMEIAGYGGSALKIQIVTFIFVIGALIYSTPLHGGIGAASVIIISLVFSLFIMAFTALVKDGLNSFSFASMLTMVVGAGMMMSVVLGALPADQGAIGLLLALLVGMVIDRDLLKSLYPA